MPTKLRQIKIQLYKLLRDYGVEVTLRTYSEAGVDFDTGTLTRTRSEVILKRAAIGGQNLISGFTYDLTYLAANKNFTYGGIFDSNTRCCITNYQGVIDKQTTKIIHDNIEYEISKLTKIVGGYGYIMILKTVGHVQDGEGAYP